MWTVSPSYMGSLEVAAATGSTRSWSSPGNSPSGQIPDPTMVRVRVRGIFSARILAIRARPRLVVVQP